MRFKVATKKNILTETLTISDAVEMLNADKGKTVGSHTYWWSYNPGHLVDSTPYIYYLWREGKQRHTAELVAQGTCVQVCGYTLLLVNGEPPKAAWRKLDPTLTGKARRRW